MKTDIDFLAHYKDVLITSIDADGETYAVRATQRLDFPKAARDVTDREIRESSSALFVRGKKGDAAVVDSIAVSKKSSTFVVEGAVFIPSEVAKRVRRAQFDYEAALSVIKSFRAQIRELEHSIDLTDPTGKEIVFKDGGEDDSTR